MNTRIVVAGTDTDIGKTVFSAGLTQALDGHYWKPVQAGISGGTDSQTVQRLSGLAPSRILRGLQAKDAGLTASRRRARRYRDRYRTLTSARLSGAARR